MNSLFLILGGNLGNRQDNVNEALKHIQNELGAIIKVSQYYQTAAWGNTNQPDFLNLACLVETKINATQCLETLMDIEQRLGRVRGKRWGARLIDIDILYFNHDIISTAQLKVPHPEMEHRKFVLVPLCEIAPDFVHPRLHISNSALLERLNDPLEVGIWREDMEQ